MRIYSDVIEERKEHYTNKFSDKSLDPRFIKYFESGQRIRVETCGLVMTGTIGITTGWVPCFLLMRTSRSIGSPWTLGPKDKILAVKHGKKYY